MISPGRWERLKNLSETALLTPFVGGASAVLTVMAGAFASFFPTDIQTHWFPWPLASSATISWKATVFWLSVGGVGLLLWGTQWAQGRLARRGRQELEGAIRRIESLPPENFLAEYQELLRRASSSALVGVSPGVGLESLDKAIRNVLNATIGVVRAYDVASPAAIYAANIMLYRKDRAQEAKAPVGFVEKVEGHPDYDGLLELVKALSTSEREADCGPDRLVPELVVPVPRDIKPVRGKDLADLHPVLPGAAWSFVHREYAGFVTISELNHWLEVRCSASEQDKERVRNYFRKDGPGAHIGSLASMPLLALGDEAKPLGVLNLHSEAPGLAAERGGDRLSPVLEPFRMMLSILLTARRAYFAPPEEPR